jgi:hypothetical protein
MSKKNIVLVLLVAILAMVISGIFVLKGSQK